MFAYEVNDGREILSDSFPSFFVLDSKEDQWIDVGWIDIPGMSRWKFASTREESFFKSSLRSIVTIMVGKEKNNETLDALVELVKQSLKSMVASKSLIPFIGPTPSCTEEEGEILVEHFSPSMIPEEAFNRFFGAGKAGEIIGMLKKSGKIVGAEWVGGMKMLIPNE